MRTASTTGNISLTPEYIVNMEKLALKKDEIGQLSNGLTAFLKHVTNISHELETIAGGDLTTAIELLSDEDMMGKSLKNVIDSLNHMFKRINTSTAQVTSSTKQVMDTSKNIAKNVSRMLIGSQSLAEGSTKQAESVEKLSSSVAEIAEKTKVNADMADNAAKHMAAIVDKAEEGIQQMNVMMTAIADITEANASIRQIMKTIDDIAFQTTILSLNASIEAARAGEHGKGFAVVAEEVRTLAAKSVKASKETDLTVQNAVVKTETGARIANETVTSLTEIVRSIQESNQMLEKIATASEEQSVGISQINSGIETVADVISQNSAVAQESAAAAQACADAAKESDAAAQEMSAQFRMLEDLISQFTLKEMA
jgi:methyl-accepting chemotaxis protein